MKRMHAEVAKSKLQHRTQSHYGNKGNDVRFGGSALRYREASQRSASRPRGPAEVVDTERDAAASYYQGSIRKVPRKWVQGYATSGNSAGEASLDTPPAISTRQLLDKVQKAGPTKERSTDEPQGDYARDGIQGKNASAFKTL